MNNNNSKNNKSKMNKNNKEKLKIKNHVVSLILKSNLNREDELYIILLSHTNKK